MVESQYLFAACQAGAQNALKLEVERRAPDWRLAFSRPGFVTFKAPSPITLASEAIPRMTFARTRGLSLGKASGSDQLDELAAQVWDNEQVRQLVADHGPVALHVWRRDEQVPGAGGFEPGRDELSALVRTGVSAAAPEGALHNPQTAPTDGAVLDIALVEPNEWWLGAHQMRSRVDRWPGGTPSIRLPEHAVSRAYLKLEEALRWAALPTHAGDVWIELGCAPGGASQALLDRGMGVIGVDPAEVDPLLTEHPDFLHFKMRAGDVRRSELQPARWLACDVNAAPQYTLDAVEPVVTHPSITIRGMILTLKLPDWSLAEPDALDEVVKRVKGWGYKDVRLRQLAFNRCELCLAALRSRGQRRLRR
ncbi:putative 23S rRNA ribose 2'-O-ribose methyltransferase [Posidoniimonas corsicana]|uniref:Putative 23S rRNA ribose 2'-O-ribose methyltransferase n=1 Tax=Posidoniimonas corsicana TaxID=1938618 RepID=A0A5C5VFF0_9BACT|nr:SAM-dependent methyltransferase [Posidoniimonas corsicana]TWT36405.1 putative 23S rRNA ribose 2'-O-ribose methyltransferase [Posidoniimonas corsicana]